MSSPRPKVLRQAEDVAPASVPQTTPSTIGYGHPEYQFVQSIMEMQKSLGEINASIATLTKSVDSTKAKVDDIVAWKNKILGGVIVVGVIASILTLVITKFSDWISIGKPEAKPQHVISQPLAEAVESPVVKKQTPTQRRSPQKKSDTSHEDAPQ